MTALPASALLSGIRVFDLTKNFAGPYATLILSDMGAEVVKLEDPKRGDETRYLPPFMSDGTSTSFASLNRGKRCVTLDLKEGGQTRSDVEALLSTCDVFIENLRPGAVDALGLGFERVAEINPGITTAASAPSARRAGTPVSPATTR